jgi:hypothetical protein
MTTEKYYVDEVEVVENEDEDDPTWDALDWNYMVKAAGDDIICICATQREADHICKLLKDNPLPVQE